MSQTILVVDDKRDMLSLIERLLTREMKDIGVRCAGDGKTALDIIAGEQVSLVLADIRMPLMDGMELLKRIRQLNSSAVVIMMTAYGTIENAVESLKLGAYDFITKPFDEERLLHTIRRALEYNALFRENLDLEKRIKDSETIGQFIGRSAPVRKLMETIRLVAKAEVTVLITGETGTGKELAARMIHALSGRATRPFIAVNCPAIPENILESELFGYKKGAFTGAASDKDGLFQTANGGTILLDEIGDISSALQAKLLRVLQEREIKPLGDNSTCRVDVRILASTNQDLKAKISSGQFREDLYYRLNVVSVHTPPLREISEDIPLMATSFLSSFCRELDVAQKKFSEDAMRMLASRKWSGNVRQLQNEVKRAVIFSKSDTITAADFGCETISLCPGDSDMSVFAGMDYKKGRRCVLEQFDRHYIGRILNETGGNITLASKKAGLERQSLQHLIRKYGIKPSAFRRDAKKI
ncbi:MAG: sigma-54 dependent transcriptional regulator [Nitrospiraceae bacterium]|nr:sigma-54 dependent transcriptional regulator [Nitrospiraceae bacterium]